MANFMGGPGCTREEVAKPPRRWDHPPHHPQADILDGDWGRYLVQRSGKGSRVFVVTHNGKRTDWSGTREQCRMMVEAHLDGVEKYGKANFVGKVLDGYALAVEYGYKQCEKGNNLEAALANYRDLMKDSK